MPGLTAALILLMLPLLVFDGQGSGHRLVEAA